MRDPNDGWADGPAGRFWGRGGAAGLLAHDPSRGVLLQHRVAWSHQGGTWGLPGGARHVGESAVDGALREANEEAGVPADGLSLRATFTFDVGYWSYTTVAMEVTTPFEAQIMDPESEELRWVLPADIADMPLHSGFASAWPGLRERIESPALLVIDAANVVGSRPNGWWKDRAGAAERLIASLGRLETSGVPGAWFGLDDAWHLWPEVLVVIEGQAKAARLDDTGRLRIVRAADDGDSAIVEAVAARPDADVTVVTADRGLRERLTPYGARSMGPSAVLDYLESD